MALFGDVAKIDFRKAAGSVDHPGDILHRIVRQSDEEKARAFLSEFEGDGFADAGAGTGHDGNLVEKTSRHEDLLAGKAQPSGARHGGASDEGKTGRLPGGSLDARSRSDRRTAHRVVSL